MHNRLSVPKVNFNGPLYGWAPATRNNCCILDQQYLDIVNIVGTLRREMSANTIEWTANQVFLWCILTAAVFDRKVVAYSLS